MTELLILAILLDGKCNMYNIKQKMKNDFSVFSSASMGAIVPALKKLNEGGYVSVKQAMTKNGRKSCVYSITNTGKDYFKELMAGEIPESIPYFNQLINIKIMLLDRLDENMREQTLTSIKRFYELHLLNTEELLEVLENRQSRDNIKSNVQASFLQHYKEKISKEIIWLQTLSR